MKTGFASKNPSKCYLCNRDYPAGTIIESYEGQDKDGNPKKRYGHVDCVNSMGQQSQQLQQPQQQRSNNTQRQDAMVDALLRIRAGIDEAIDIIRSAA